MIDWLKISLQYSNAARPYAGQIISTDAEDETIYSINKMVPILGKHNAHLSITDNSRSRIILEGNFAKFLQGHNVFGTGNLNYLVQEVLKDLILRGILKPTIEEKLDWFSGKYEIKRVDCNVNWKFPNRETVTGWLQQLALNAKLKHAPPNIFERSIYFGQHSRHWSFKFYAKYEQLTKSKHRLPKEIYCRDELLNWSKNIVRGELVLRDRKLKSINLDQGYKWNFDTAQNLCFEFLKEIDISSKSKIQKLEIQGLSNTLFGVFSRYIMGEDLRSKYPKTTYDRFRRQLLVFGIDISAPYSGSDQQEYELNDFISIDSLSGIPDFAIGTYLYNSCN